jgi:hypothetical protein
VTFAAASDRDVACMSLGVPVGRARHVVATLRREVFVLTVRVPSIAVEPSGALPRGEHGDALGLEGCALAGQRLRDWMSSHANGSEL